MYEDGIKTVWNKQDSQKCIIQVPIFRNILYYNKKINQEREDLRFGKQEIQNKRVVKRNFQDNDCEVWDYHCIASLEINFCTPEQKNGRGSRKN